MLPSFVVGVAFWALPLFVVWFAVSPGETQIWLGDLRVVAVVSCVGFGL